VTPNRLYRSRDRQLAGVAGGMADYLGIDPTIVRILWILAGLFSGGLLVLGYIILAFVIPERPYATPPTHGWTAPASTGAPTWGGAPASAGAPTWGANAAAGWAPTAPSAPAWSPDWAAQAAGEQQARERARGRGPGAGAIAGVVLVVFGVIALVDTVAPGWVAAAVFGPALLVALGAALLVGSLRRTDTSGPAAAGAGNGSVTTPSAPAEDGPESATYDSDATASVDLGSTADAGPAPEIDRR